MTYYYFVFYFRNPVRRNLKNADFEEFFGSKLDKEILEANADLEEAPDASHDEEAATQEAASQSKTAKQEDVRTAADVAESSKTEQQVAAKNHPPTQAARRLNTVLPVNTKVGITS